ncbi:hypothetical protein JC2156_08370 [Weissella koreensis KCTC 3621]|nr:hypothetical protein JC2156_08370 [Weissella koreensis KCTC 3621]
MDLNLYILNTFPFFPTLICEKNIYPLGSSNLIATIIIKKIGDNTSNPKAEHTRSKQRFSIKYAQ